MTNTFKVHIPLQAPKWLLCVSSNPSRIENSLPLQLKSISFQSYKYVTYFL